MLEFGKGLLMFSAGTIVWGVLLGLAEAARQQRRVASDHQIQLLYGADSAFFFEINP